MQLKKSEKEQTKYPEGNKGNELIKIKAEISKLGRKKKQETIAQQTDPKVGSQGEKTKKQEQKLDKLLDCLIRKNLERS